MKSLFKGLLVLVFVASLGVGLGGRFGGEAAVPDWLPGWLSSSPAPAAGPAAEGAPTVSGSEHGLGDVDQETTAAIQQVIQHSNDEQVQAIAARDPSLMSDTLTSDHLQELVRINQDLISNGVTSITLVKVEWGAIAVNGSTATATTYETWTTALSDGSSDQSRDRNDYSLVLDNGAWKISTDAHPDAAQLPAGAGQPDPRAITPPPLLPFPGVPNAQDTSHNWSGYAATGGKYTAVSGTWTVPQFSADGSFGIDAAWVGIGGVRSRDLIQAGTQQTVSGSGSTQYQAWIETLPQASHSVPLRVHAGDSVSVSIAEQSPDVWSIAFTNVTTGQTYQTTTQYTSSKSSAEWVEEAPSGGRGGGVLPLDNFGTVPFSGASAVKDGQTVSAAGANARAITMVGSGEQALAVPSKLSDDGASFSVARTDVTATTPTGPGTSSTSGTGGRPRGRRSGP